MEFLNVFSAAMAAFAFGAIWYGVWAKKWMEAADVPVGEDGNPVNSSNPMIYFTGFLCMLICAGMMRHVFELGGIDTLGKSLVAGLGIGLFMVTPWLVTHYSFSNKPRALMLIDGGYATLGCMLIGAILALF